MELRPALLPSSKYATGSADTIFFFNLLFQLTFIEHLLGKCVVLEASIGVG